MIFSLFLHVSPQPANPDISPNPITSDLVKYYCILIL